MKLLWFYLLLCSFFSSGVCWANTNIYGCAWNADGLANLEVGKQPGRTISYRFRADRTEMAYGVQIYLIFRALGYYKGDGGHVLLQLQTDDVTPNHLPSGEVLTSSLVTDPMAQKWNRFFRFDTPVQLQKGTLYHLVFTNPAPDPINNYVSLDLLYRNTATRNSMHASNMQPCISDIDLACIWKFSNKSDWKTYHSTPIFCLYYNDGTFQGQGYMDAWVGSAVAISGENKVREFFTVSGTNRTVSKVSVRLKKNGSPEDLTVRLECSTGVLIEEGRIPAATISDNYDWVTYNFKVNHLLESGKTYRLELSAPPGDSYSLFPLQEGVQYGFKTPGMFTDGHLQCTSGSSWKNFKNRTDFDMQFYFTIKE